MVGVDAMHVGTLLSSMSSVGMMDGTVAHLQHYCS